jgi:cobalt-zinc-cadmium efflux system membrane fusion protein
MDLHDDLGAHSPEARVMSPLPKGLPRRSQVAILLTVIVVAAAAIVIGVPGVPGLIGLKSPEKIAEEPAQASDGKSVTLTDRQWGTVKIAPVEQRVFQNAAVTDGKIAVDDDLVTPVFSPYTGRVTKLFARAGDTVNRGDPLFAIQASELAQAQNDLISAAATLRTAKAQLQLSTTNEKRQHDLYLAQGAALKDWQQAQVDLATAQGGANSAAIALRAVRNRMAILGKSDAEIDAIAAASDLAQLDAETIVTAPIAGTVVQRQVGLGQNIVSASSGAQNPVFQMGDTSKVWLIANVREGDAPLMHKGDPVDVDVMAFPNRVFHARLTYVASAIDPNTHRLPVRAEVDNRTGELKPEMFATFRIVTGEDATATAVPEEAVVFEGSTAHVWVAHPDAKTLEIRPIVPGRTHGGLIEVLSGLAPDDHIVTSGAVFIDRAAAGD